MQKKINSNGVRENQEEPSALFSVITMRALQARKNGAIGCSGESLDDRDIARAGGIRRRVSL